MNKVFTKSRNFLNQLNTASRKIDCINTAKSNQKLKKSPSIKTNPEDDNLNLINHVSNSFNEMRLVKKSI